MVFEKIIATFFGSGYFPVGPGTAGSALAVLLWYLLFSTSIVSFQPWIIQTALIGVAILAGTWATARLQTIWGKDPSRIVIDEAIGIWITYLFVPCHWHYLVLGFVLFRFFDIVKPLGIRKTEAYFGAFGVILDDIVAGFYAWIIMMVVVYFQWLG